MVVCGVILANKLQRKAITKINWCDVSFSITRKWGECCTHKRMFNFDLNDGICANIYGESESCTIHFVSICFVLSSEQTQYIEKKERNSLVHFENCKNNMKNIWAVWPLANAFTIGKHNRQKRSNGNIDNSVRLKGSDEGSIQLFLCACSSVRICGKDSFSVAYVV